MPGLIREKRLAEMGDRMNQAWEEGRSPWDELDVGVTRDDLVWLANLNPIAVQAWIQHWGGAPVGRGG